MDDRCAEESAASTFAETILSLGEACLIANDYGHAFANYLMVIKVAPQYKSHVKEQFCIAMNEWVAELDQRGQTKDAFWCYEQALELWPDNDIVLSSMGAHLFRLGFPSEAASYLRKALQINPDLRSAKDSLQSIAGSVIERWHFRMLNDTTRNSGYYAAIQEAIREGRDTVLDIGSGTGLLSMFAVQAGAKKVYACEMSKTMYDVSCDVLTANQMQDSISLFHKKSSNLKIPDDLPSRVSLVITETMDAGLFGEHILKTLDYAWQHLLLPDGKVIPSGATVYGQVIECQALRKQHRIVSHSIGNLSLQDIDITSKTGYSRTSSGKHTKMANDDDREPYTSDKLSAIPGGYKTLTPVFKVAEVNFNNPKDLKKWQTLRQNKSHVTKPVHRSGQVDAIVTWFDLSLDNNHSLSTDPDSKSCWEQAVFPVHLNQLKGDCLDRDSLNVTKGDSITVSISCSNNHLNLMCHQISHNAMQSCDKSKSVSCDKTCDTQEIFHDAIQSCDKSKSASTVLESSVTGDEPVSCDKTCDTQEISHDASNNANRCLESSNLESSVCSESMSHDLELPDIESMDLNATGHTHATHQRSGGGCGGDSSCHANVDKRTSLQLDERDIAFLNDIKSQNAVLCALQVAMRASKPLASKIADTGRDGIAMETEDVLQTSREPTTHGALGTNIDDTFSILDLSHGLSLAGLYAAKLGTDDDTKTHVCITQSSLDVKHALQCIGRSNGLNMDFSVVFEARSSILSPHTNAFWDVVVVDLVESTGVLRQHVLEDIAVARTYCLKPRGTLLPGKMTVFGMCIESDSLLADSMALGDQCTMGIKVDKHINVFKVSRQLDLTLPTLDYTQLSLPFLLFQFDFNAPINDDHIPPYLHQSKKIVVDIKHDGILMAIPFWFDLGFDRENHANTLDSDTHWKQAAYLLDQPLTVKKGDKIDVIASLQNSSIWFDVKKA